MWISDKAPFLLSVLLAVCGWTFSQIVGRLAASPYLEYRLEEKLVGKSSLAVSYELSNLSRSKTLKIKKIRISFDGLSTGLSCATRPAVLIPPPIISDDSEDAPACEEGSPTGIISPPALPPGGLIRINLNLNSATKLGQIPPSQIRISSDQPIFLSEAGTETYVVRHDLGILITFFFIWLTLIVGYLIYWSLRSAAP